MVDLIGLDDLGYNRKRKIKDDAMYLHRQCRMKVVLFTEMTKMSEGHICFLTTPEPIQPGPEGESIN